MLLAFRLEGRRAATLLPPRLPAWNNASEVGGRSQLRSRRSTSLGDESVGTKEELCT